MTLALRLAVMASHPIQYCAPLYRALAARFDLQVFYAHRATESDQAKAGFGVGFDWDVDLLSGYEHAFLRNAARQPGLDHFAGCDTPEIGPRLKQGGFDALLVQGWHLKCFVQAAFAAKQLGIPVLARGDSQLNTPRSPLKRLTKALLYPPLLRVFDAALYVGKRSHAYWRHYGYPESRLFFSPHCVDTEWFAARATDEARNVLRARLGIAPESKVALFAGKLVPFKRPLDLIAAAGLLKTQDLELSILIAGSGPFEHEMAEAARNAGVPYHPLGFRNQSEMSAAYAAADVLVLPSDGRETWGLVANEALACGRPIVLSDAVGAASDLAVDGTAGRVFPMGKIPMLANALRDVFANPPLKSEIVHKSSFYSLRAASDGIFAATSFVRPAACRRHA